MIARMTPKRRAPLCNVQPVSPEEAAAVLRAFRFGRPEPSEARCELADTSLPAMFDGLPQRLRIACMLATGSSVGAVADRLEVHRMAVVRVATQLSKRVGLGVLREEIAATPREQVAATVSYRTGWSK